MQLVTPHRLRMFALDSLKGGQLVYHIGSIASDASAASPLTAPEMRNARKIRDLCLHFVDRGLITTTQRKIGPGMYEYIAVKI